VGKTLLEKRGKKKDKGGKGEAVGVAVSTANVSKGKKRPEGGRVGKSQKPMATVGGEKS